MPLYKSKIRHNSVATDSTAAYLFMTGIHHLPCLFNLLLERLNRVLVLLAQLQRRLNLRRICNDLRIELAALFYETFLTFCVYRFRSHISN
jgi:hypothetical protein